MKRVRLVAAVAILGMVAVACGAQTIVVRATGGEAAVGGTESANLSEGGGQAVSVGEAQLQQQGKGDPKCAVNANADQGFTSDSIKWGSVITVSGIFQKLGQQTAKVMKVASEQWLNSITKIPGPYPLEWGCSTRPGIYGRKVSLQIFTLTSRTAPDAQAAMRRLIDVEKVFLVRDCYLQSDIMGSATDYQNSKNVPGVWCSFSEMPQPALAKWNFSPGTDPLKIVGIHVGWLLNNPNPNLSKNRLAIIKDPTADSALAVAKKVAAGLGKPIEDSCVVEKPGAEAQNGMDAEIGKLRGCHKGQDPDAVMAFDAANGAFGAYYAAKNRWDPQANNVQWACATCWVITLAELCGPPCNGMITDCQALPCIPWSDPKKFPASEVLEYKVRRQYLASEPIDILTYGPAAITGGLGLWLGMTGPKLSRDSFRNTLENLKDWDAGIGPILNTGPKDHYGGKSIWLIQFCGSQNCDPQGKAPWFKDMTGRFVPLSEVGVSESWTTTQ